MEGSSLNRPSPSGSTDSTALQTEHASSRIAIAKHRILPVLYDPKGSGDAEGRGTSDFRGLAGASDLPLGQPPGAAMLLPALNVILNDSRGGIQWSARKKCFVLLNFAGLMYRSAH